MKRDDIIHLAQEAGLTVSLGSPLHQKLQVFAALVAAAEREACAVIGEQNAPDDGGLWIGNVIAAAIRERG